MVLIPVTAARWKSTDFSLLRPYLKSSETSAVTPSVWYGAIGSSAVVFRGSGWLTGGLPHYWVFPPSAVASPSGLDPQSVYIH